MNALDVDAARERLRLAHAARTEADRVLGEAKAASERARKFAVAARDRCAGIEEETRGAALDRSIAVKAALLAGETPVFEVLPGLTANALALRELESRALAAEIAEHDLSALEDDARRASTLAQDEVRYEAEALMIAEADEIAREVLDLEARALNLRVRLGNGLSPIATRGLALSAATVRVLSESDARAEAILRDGRLWNAQKAAAAVWAGRVATLIADADAELNFGEPHGEEARAA